jgi:predicted PurR-regulated permease PerM
LSSLFLGLSAFFVLLIFQIPFALALAMIIGTLNLIPGIGGTLGGLIATLIALIQGGGADALKVLLTSTFLQQIENVISTRVMQSTVNLNPVVVFFALLIGAKVAGLLGVILSVPIAGIVSSLLEIEEMRSS